MGAKTDKNREEARAFRLKTRNGKGSLKAQQVQARQRKVVLLRKPHLTDWIVMMMQTKVNHQKLQLLVLARRPKIVLLVQQVSAKRPRRARPVQQEYPKTKILRMVMMKAKLQNLQRVLARVRIVV